LVDYPSFPFQQFFFEHQSPSTDKKKVSFIFFGKIPFLFKTIFQLFVDQSDALKLDFRGKTVKRRISWRQRDKSNLLPNFGTMEVFFF
jgi:hypothetical protein